MALVPIAKKKYSGQTGERNTKGSDRQDEPYIVVGAGSIAEAVATALNAAAAAGETTIIADGGITLEQVGVSWDFIAESETADGLAQAYEVAIRYGTNSLTKRDVGDVRLSYDTTGGTIHQVFAHGETVYPAMGTNTAQFNKIIGNQGDSTEGTDAPGPVFNLTVTKIFARADLPAPGDIFWLSGKYNAANFTVTDSGTHETITFLPGEAVFLGARHPEARADGAIEMTYVLTGSPNVTNVTVGDITGVDKMGAQYVWLRFHKDTSGLGDGKVAVLKTKYVVVNDVLLSGDFGLLRI